MPRIVIAVRTMVRKESGIIGAAETTATQRTVTPDRRSHFKERVVDHKKRRKMRETRRAVKIPREDAANSLPTRCGIDQATVSVLKLMIIIQMYARF